MPVKPYIHVRIIPDDSIKHRIEIRVSTFIEYDDDPRRRGITNKPSRDEAIEAAKEIAKAERDKLP
jgi:hypothetical protein